MFTKVFDKYVARCVAISTSRILTMMTFKGLGASHVPIHVSTATTRDCSALFADQHHLAIVMFRNGAIERLGNGHKATWPSFCADHSPDSGYAAGDASRLVSWNNAAYDGPLPGSIWTGADRDDDTSAGCG